MAKPELGVKRTCPECGARFYDLSKNPAKCPKCETEFDPLALLRPQRGRQAEAAKPAPAPEKTSEVKDKDAKTDDAAESDDDIDDIEDIDEIEDIDDIDDDTDDDDDDDDVIGVIDTTKDKDDETG